MIENQPSTLRGYWTLEGENGGVWADSSGRNNHLSATNNVTTTTGQVGLAADFELDNQQYLSIADGSQDGLNITGDLTMVGWVKPESPTGLVIGGKYHWGQSSQPNAAYRLSLNGSGNLTWIVSPNGLFSEDYALSGSSVLTAGQWHHVAGVFDSGSGQLRVYVDGVLDGSKSVSYNAINVTTEAFYLGANTNGSGQAAQFFDGALDEWRVYAEALSESDIEALLNQTEELVAGLTLSSDSPTDMGQTTVLTATMTAGSNLTYTWNFGDGSALVTNGAVITHTYSATGTYTAIVTASNAVSSQSTTTTVTIQDAPPTASFVSSSPDVLGEITSFTNQSTGSNLSYQWSFGEGTALVTTANPTHTYATTGTFTVVLTATNSLGSDVATGTVTINDQPSTLRGHWTLDETSGQRADSSGNTNHLTETNTVGSVGGQISQAADLEASSNQYLSIDDGVQSGLAITGSLTLVGWMRSESLGSTEQILASKYEYGSVNNRGYRFDIREAGDKLGFLISSDGTFNSNYLLEAVISPSLSLNTWYHVAAVYDASGQMTIYLDGDEVDSQSVTPINIFASTAPFILGANVNSGSVVQFFDGALDEWRVYAEALSESDIETLMNQAETPGSGLALISDSPTALGQPTILTATVTAGSNVNYQWDFGDGTAPVTNGAAITHTYGTTGSYTVVVTASNAVSTASTTTTVTVQDEPPVASFTTSSPDLLGQTTTFTNTSIGSNLSYEWNFGDGAVLTTTTHPTHTYATTGTFTVSLTATNSLGTDTVTDTVVITPAVTAISGLSLSSDSPTVLGEVTTLSGSVTAGSDITYDWELGDGILVSDGGSTITHTYGTSGTFTVVLTASNALGSEAVTGTVIIEDAASLRGYWPLSQPSGMRLDLSSYGNHLSPTSAISSSVGQVGRATTLTGGYLTISHTLQSGLDITGSLTLVGWMKPASLGSTDQILAAKYEFGTINNRGYRFDVRNSGDTLGFVLSPNGSFNSNYLLEATISPTLSLDTWYHVAAVYDNAAETMTLYLDGTSVGSKINVSGPLFASTAPFMLGANVNSGSAVQFFDGTLDEWRVYSTALDQSTIQSLRALTEEPLTGLTVSNDSPKVEGQTVTLTANVTSGSPLTYTWAFGDGATAVTTDTTGQGVVITHTYTQAGSYTGLVTATNPAETITTTTIITITEPLSLTLRKSGPSVVALGDPINYSLTLTNPHPLTLTNIVITDVVPSGASYVSGGFLEGDEVRWFVPSLGPTSSTQLSFMVTATATVTNTTYGLTDVGDYEELTPKLLEPVAEAGPGGLGNDQFGQSVAISEDSAIVGAYLNDRDGTDAGLAYIFEREGGSWGATPTTLTTRDADASDLFGYSVAIDGDLAVVGAYQNETPSVASGAAHVFQRSGASWFEVRPRIAANDIASGDQFGFSVAIDGNRMVIGAPGEDDEGDGAGAAYTFVLSGTNWVQEEKLTASDGQANDAFGSSVALDGERLIVGAWQEDERGANAGAAYIFAWNGSTWQEEEKVTANDGEASDFFGYTVDLDQNLAVIGAYGEDEQANQAGAAYIFTHQNGSWSQQTKLTASDGQASDNFGRSVALEADTVVVGANEADGQGAAYIFVSQGSTWSEQPKLTADNLSSGDQFGHSVALSAHTVLIGAYGDDEQANDAGAAYLFSRGPGTRLYATGQVPVTTQVVSTTTLRDWQLITGTTSTPPIINAPAMAYDRGQSTVVLFGGNATGWRYEDATWEFDGSDWSLISTTQQPSARYGTTLAYDSSAGAVILFGGSDENDVVLNQTWQYANSDWSQVTITSTIPASRTQHVLAADRVSGAVYLFGGNDSGTYYDDVWRYQAGAWTEVTVSGDKPAARTLAAMAYDTDRDRLLLFGGRTVTGTLLADVWEFNPVGSTWQLLDDGGGGNGPPARIGHTLTYDPDTTNFVMVGGDALGTTWHYRVGLGWTQVTPATPLPAQSYHQAVYTDDAIILFSREAGWRYE